MNIKLYKGSTQGKIRKRGGVGGFDNVPAAQKTEEPNSLRRQTRQLRNDKAKEKIEARVGRSEAGVRPQHLSWELTTVIVVVDEPLL